MLKKKQGKNPYSEIINWFSKNNHIDILLNATNEEYKSILLKIPGLKSVINKYQADADETISLLFMEFILHGLSEYSMLSKFGLQSGFQFKDMLSSMFTSKDSDNFEDQINEEDPDLF